MQGIKLTGVKNYLSSIPIKEELEKLTAKELFIICLRHQIGLKELLINFILTKKKI